MPAHLPVRLLSLRCLNSNPHTTMRCTSVISAHCPGLLLCHLMLTSDIHIFGGVPQERDSPLSVVVLAQIPCCVYRQCKTCLSHPNTLLCSQAVQHLSQPSQQSHNHVILNKRCPTYLRMQILFGLTSFERPQAVVRCALAVGARTPGRLLITQVT